MEGPQTFLPRRKSSHQLALTGGERLDGAVARLVDQTLQPPYFGGQLFEAGELSRSLSVLIDILRLEESSFRLEPCQLRLGVLYVSGQLQRLELSINSGMQAAQVLRQLLGGLSSLVDVGHHREGLVEAWVSIERISNHALHLVPELPTQSLNL